MTSSDIQVAVVDDDESLCRSMSRLLRASNLCPTVFASAEALLADDGLFVFDCIVLDVQLEGMTGLELCQHLTETKAAAPVIIITAQDDPEVEHRAIQAGCFQFFHKTDPGREVLAAIHRAIAQHRLRAERSTSE